MKTLNDIAKKSIEEIEMEIKSHERTIIMLSLEIERLRVSKSRVLGIEESIGTKKVHEVLGLSVRTTNCLQDAGLTDMTDLILFIEQNGESGLLKLKNFGRRSLNELRVEFKEQNIPWMRGKLRGY